MHVFFADERFTPKRILFSSGDRTITDFFEDTLEEIAFYQLTHVYTLIRAARVLSGAQFLVAAYSIHPAGRKPSLAQHFLTIEADGSAMFRSGQSMQEVLEAHERSSPRPTVIFGTERQTDHWAEAPVWRREGGKTERDWQRVAWFEEQCRQLRILG